jgi:hypothetical protein
MLIGIDLFGMVPFGGAVDSFQLPWFEICPAESDWEEINRIELDIRRCNDAN